MSLLRRTGLDWTKGARTVLLHAFPVATTSYRNVRLYGRGCGRECVAEIIAWAALDSYRNHHVQAALNACCNGLVH